MTDVSGQAGVSFQHTDGGSGQQYIVELMVAGLATFDYDAWDIDRPTLSNGERVAGAAKVRIEKRGTLNPAVCFTRKLGTKSEAVVRYRLDPVRPALQIVGLRTGVTRASLHAVDSWHRLQSLGVTSTDTWVPAWAQASTSVGSAAWQSTHPMPALAWRLRSHSM